jgi:hypothetical protein
MDFKKAVSVSLLLDYWILKRVSEKNHSLNFKFILEMSPLLEELNISPFGIKSFESEVLNFKLNSVKDLHEFEARFFSMVSRLREEFNVYGASIDIEDEEKRKRISEVYISDIENFFKSDNTNSVRIPLTSDEDEITYFIHDCDRQSVYIDDEI